ncbi:4-hydroxy-3-methylbut-2-en-1-yl diphosphate synthase [bacterium]|nr:MAG: 4-hydroxy-3-methylbut-2-en-1-yl diphosphate synthase [bacterium]
MNDEQKIKYKRTNTRPVKVGDVIIGGDSPITVQSMAKVPTTDVSAVLDQCERVFRAGGDIFRVSIPDSDSADALKEIVKHSPIPIVADIHFDYRLALESLKSGAHKLRINPGNIGFSERVKIIAKEAKSRNVPIRIGVNSGSIPKDILEKYGKPDARALLESAEREIIILQEIGFEDIIVSLKSTVPQITRAANVMFAQKYDYPLHLGITESGFGYQGIVSSSTGLAIILDSGIGNTIRVSLTESPETEIRIGREILRSMGLRRYGIRLISCPICARCKVQLKYIAERIWNNIKDMDEDITVAVMGCEVNGPGEARFADIGVACGDKVGLIFKNGEPIKKVKDSEIIAALLDEINELIDTPR